MKYTLVDNVKHIFHYIISTNPTIILLICNYIYNSYGISINLRQLTYLNRYKIRLFIHNKASQNIITSHSPNKKNI